MLLDQKLKKLYLHQLYLIFQRYNQQLSCYFIDGKADGKTTVKSPLHTKISLFHDSTIPFATPYLNLLSFALEMMVSPGITFFENLTLFIEEKFVFVLCIQVKLIQSL